MNKIAEQSMLINDSAYQVYMIYTPANRLLKIAFILQTVLITLLSVTFNYLIAIITVPLIFFWVYFFYLFCRIWKRYAFSTLYLVLLPVFSVIFSFFIMLTISIVLR